MTTTSTLTHCPLCLAETNWDKCKLVSAAGQELTHPSGKGLLNYGAFEEARRSNQLAITRQILQEQPQVECPSGDRLPLFVVQHRIVTIGVVGSTAASKSTLITAMVQALRTESRGGGGLSLLAAAGGGQYDIEARVRTVFARRELLPTTVTDREQPIFLLTRNTSNGAMICLLFRDISGDDFSTLSTAQQRGYLAGVDGLMYVVDVTRIRGVADRLQTNEDYEPTGVVLGNFLTVLNSIAATDSIPESGRTLPHSMPVSVVFSKSDLVLSFESFRVRDHLSSSHHEEGPLLDWQRIKAETLDAMGLALNYGERSAVDLVLSNFWSFSFHFASATGTGSASESDGVVRYARSPIPLGVTTPLLTILARLALLTPGQYSGEDYLPAYPKVQEQ